MMVFHILLIFLSLMYCIELEAMHLIINGLYYYIIRLVSEVEGKH